MHLWLDNSDARHVLHSTTCGVASNTGIISSEEIFPEYSVICKEYSEKGYKHLRMHTRIVRLTLFVLQFLLRKYSKNILPKCINTICVLLRSSQLDLLSHDPFARVLSLFGTRSWVRKCWTQDRFTDRD